MTKFSILQICLLCCILITPSYLHGQDEPIVTFGDIMNMSLDELFKIKVLTADREPDQISNTPASVLVVSREEIEVYGYQSLVEILESIPGFYYIDDYGDSGEKFGIRGFWSDVGNNNIMIMVNGIQQVDHFNSSYPITMIPIPVEAIDRIEVIRGPMSVIYGNGAFYGTINIITNSKNETNRISGTYGSNNTRKLFGRAAGESDNLSYSLNASVSGTNGIDIPLRDLVSNPNILNDYGLTIDSRTKDFLVNNNKYINFAGKYKSLTLNVSLSDGFRRDYFLFPSVSNDYGCRITTTRIQSIYHTKITESSSLSASLGISDTRSQYKYNVLSPDFYGYQEISTKAVESELNYFYKPNDKLDIKTGLYYLSIYDAKNQYDLPSYHIASLENQNKYLPFGSSMDTRAIYLQTSYFPTNKIQIIGGLRLEQTPKYKLASFHALGDGFSEQLDATYKQDQIEFIPRLGIIYKLNTQNILKFLYGKAVNRPSFYQNTKNSLDPNRNDLKPEKIQTLEFNFLSTINNKLSINLSYFYNLLDNLISRIVKFDENEGYQSWSENAGKMNTHGVEAMVIFKPFDRFKIDLSGTYQKTKDNRSEFETIKVAYSPNFLGYVKASYYHNRISVGLTGNYVDSMEPFWDQTKPDPDGRIRLGNRIGSKTEAHIVFSGNIRVKNLLNNNWFFDLRCSNLLNSEYRYPTHTNNEWIDKGSIGMGRSFSLSLGRDL